MRAVIQRVHRASVTVEKEIVGKIGKGLLVLLGVAPEDSERDVEYLADKIVHLRIFEDDAGKMNRSLLQEKGEMLVVSQFTLLGDCRKGRRPSFIGAAPPALAETRYLEFVEAVRAKGVSAATGKFGAMMDVGLINNGPVTIILESR